MDAQLKRLAPGKQIMTPAIEKTMLANDFHGVNDIRVEQVKRPRVGVGGQRVFGNRLENVLKVAIRP